jgi:hypothetical protein
MIIGIIGWIGSGKDTAAEYLVEKHDFTQLGFADSLKLAVADIFHWDFELLLGHTKESREWREQVDTWWSNRLGMPDLTPRKVLQQWGTEVGRNSFHQDIWIASVEKKLLQSNKNIVVSDCRFKNEINAIKKAGGFTIRINRGPLPAWYDTAKNELEYLEKFGVETGFESNMYLEYPEVHISEWGWITQKFDLEIDNNKDLQNLYKQLDDFIANNR